MSKITNDDVAAMMMAWDRSRSMGAFDGMALRVAGEVLAERVERRVLARVNAETKPIHEPVSGPEVLEMATAAAAVAPGEFFFDREERMRAAGNALLARRAAPELKPMHEPVTNAEIDDFMRAISDPYEGNMTPREVTGIALDQLLARRAAATRAEVVVTEEDVCRACHAWQTTGESIGEGMLAALQTFADRLNGKPEKTANPRIKIVRDWLVEISLDMVFEESGKTIEELLAKLDEVKP